MTTPTAHFDFPLPSSRFRTIRLALKSLLLHKLRSGLTMLGIVFGVFSVIAMLAIGEGASRQAEAQVLQLGATNIIVRSVKPPDDPSSSSGNMGRSSVLRYGLTQQDYTILSRTLPTVVGLVPMREVIMEVRRQDRVMNGRVVGCTPGYQEMNLLTVQQGRFLTDRDDHDTANCVVLGAGTARELFPIDDPLGESVLIGSRAYRVIGVMADRTASAGVGGSLSAQDFNRDVYMPIGTFQSRINTSNVFTKFTAGNFSAESVVYNQITLRVRSKDDVIATAEVIRETIQRLHPRPDYDVVVPLELLRQADQIRNIFNIVLGSIAGISLVVGGIGIMNIMLATVTERTREIGVRRALGARRKDITRQFLVETIVLSGSGGAIGLLMGLATPYVFYSVKWFLQAYVLDAGAATSDFGKLFLGMTPQIAIWSLPVAFGFSVLTGLIFGVYPARSAARLDPIEALRHV